MKELTVEEKIAEIKNTNSYQDVKNAWFPPYHEKEYYFVSYSHKDYKLVYESLHRLQSGERRLDLWYDHNLAPGRDWEIEARRYIYDFNCKGVIFFLSENAVLSRSIHKEIEFVKESGKEYLSINLPCEKIEGHIGEYLSAVKMLELLKQQDYAIENYEEKAAVLRETFNDKITFLPFNEDIDSQITKILSLKRQPLLEIDKTWGIVVSINNLYAEVVKEDDFKYLDDNDECIFAEEIGNCAFANCRCVKKIELPKSITCIDNFAFYNCCNLVELMIKKNVTFIGSNAFTDCINLEKINVDKNNKIFSSQDGILYNKDKTEFIYIPQAIRGEITIPQGIASIEQGMFSGCCNIESINVDVNNTKYSSLDGILYNKNKTELIEVPPTRVTVSIPDSVTSIFYDAFDNCANLTNIIISNNVTSIHRWALGRCANLKNIYYHGTKKQWKSIDKDDGWDDDTSDYTIHCADGDLKKRAVD